MRPIALVVWREDWSDWLDGPPDDARLLCRPYPDLMVVNRTNDRWVRRPLTAKSVGCIYKAVAQVDAPAGRDD